MVAMSRVIFHIVCTLCQKKTAIAPDQNKKFF